MKQHDIQSHLSRSHQALSAAKSLLANEFNEDAMSRAYYSILHAAKAALLAHNQIAKSHSGVRNLFGEHLIKPGLIEKEWGKILSDEFALRGAADYDAYFVADIEDVEEMVKDAERFLNRIKDYLQQNGIELKRK